MGRIASTGCGATDWRLDAADNQSPAGAMGGDPTRTVPAELAAVDQLLDDPAFLVSFHGHFHPVLGRPPQAPLQLGPHPARRPGGYSHLVRSRGIRPQPGPDHQPDRRQRAAGRAPAGDVDCRHPLAKTTWTGRAPPRWTPSPATTGVGVARRSFSKTK